jgi:DNA-binding transcriptional LysR family regulator
MYPKVDVKIEISDSGKILNKLLDRQVDVGIVGLYQQSNKIKTRSIASDSLVLIVPIEHSLSQLSELDFDKLKQYDIVLREEGSGTRKEMEEYLAGNGYSLSDFNKSISINNSEAVITAVEAGLGISFVSKLAAMPAANANRIKIIEAFTPYKRSFYFSTLSETDNRPIIREFSDFLTTRIMPIS